MTTALTTRVTAGTGATVKGLPLTNAEIDNNFLSLNNNKLETSWTGNANIVTLGTVTTGTWSATTISTAKGGTGLTSFTNGGAVYATSTSALTTGTLPIASGGTGITTAPTSGKLLIGTSTGGYSSANLTGTTNQITVTNGSGSITLSLPQSINTAADVQFGSFGVGVAATGTAGQIRASDNILAFQTSDKKFKENISDIPNALEAVLAIGGKLYDWTDEYVDNNGGDDGYFIRKNDFGVIAQDVQQAFPLGVREKEDGTLVVDYQKLCALAFAAIKDLNNQIQEIKGIK